MHINTLNETVLNKKVVYYCKQGEKKYKTKLLSNDRPSMKTMTNQAELSL